LRETVKKILKTEWFLAKLMFETDLWMGILYWGLIGALHGIPLVNTWVWKLILDEFTAIWVSGTAGYAVWLYLGVYLSLQVTVSLSEWVASVVFNQIHRKATRRLDVQIMQKMATIDMAFFDDPKNADKLRAAQTSENYITGNMYWAVDVTVRTVTFLSGLVMFLSYNLWFGLLYIATYIPGAILSYRNKTKVDQFSLDNIPETRKKDYYKSLLTGSATAMDLRLYNLADHFKGEYNRLWNKIRAERAKLFQKSSREAFLASILTQIGTVVILLLSVRSVAAGTMAVGTLALYLGLAKASGANFATLVDGIASQIEIDVPRVHSYLDFLAYENAVKDDGTELVPVCPDIEFRNVSFKYPGNEEYTLKKLNLKIKSGQKIALLGVNGAGKTTLIKLLLGFYTPESGEILIGGKPLGAYSAEERNRLFGVCFQQVQKYSLSLRENIAISDIGRQQEDAAVLAAAKAAGADSIIAAAPDGLDAPMTRMFENNGLELSGGQWQKIALARAFFRDSRFVILDEPSSALDPEAEDYIFTSFKQLCADRGGILISHRLSGVMMVDTIVLLDKGTVIESGTHDTLMAQNGKYAEMYRLQAEKYVGGDANE